MKRINGFLLVNIGHFYEYYLASTVYPFVSAMLVAAAGKFHFHDRLPGFVTAGILFNLIPAIAVGMVSLYFSINFLIRLVIIPKSRSRAAGWIALAMFCVNFIFIQYLGLTVSELTDFEWYPE